MIKRQSKPLVILIHGLHMHAWAMRPLAKKLSKLGYECHRFGYFSVTHNLANHSRRLHRWLTKHEKAGVPIYLSVIAWVGWSFATFCSAIHSGRLRAV